MIAFAEVAAVIIVFYALLLVITHHIEKRELKQLQKRFKNRG